jgi:hypothetical protein
LGGGRDEICQLVGSEPQVVKAENAFSQPAEDTGARALTLCRAD